MKAWIARLFLAGAMTSFIVAAAAAADFEWKMFTIYGVADKQTEWMRGFASDVKEATGGRLNITVFSGGELPYKGVDVFRALSRKQIEIGHTPAGFVAPDLPLLNVTSMPFVCTDMDKFLDGGLPKVRAVLDERIQEKFRVTPLVHWAMPGQQIFSRSLVKEPRDLKGLKIRTWNQGQVATLDKLGATSVSLTTAEVTPGLQQGVIDGAITAAVNASAWKWYEVAKSGYMFNITLSHELIAANTAALAALPEDVRAALKTVAAKWETRLRGEVGTLDSQARGDLTGHGMVLTDVTGKDAADLRAVTADIGVAWAKQNGELAEKTLAALAEGCR